MLNSPSLEQGNTFGVVAQLGARLNGIQKVRGSNPLNSTKKSPAFVRGILLLDSNAIVLSFVVQ